MWRFFFSGYSGRGNQESTVKSEPETEATARRGLYVLKAVFAYLR